MWLVLVGVNGDGTRSGALARIAYINGVRFLDSLTKNLVGSMLCC